MSHRVATSLTDPDRNPLRRRSDQAEAGIVVLLVAGLLVAGHQQARRIAAFIDRHLRT